MSHARRSGFDLEPGRRLGSHYEVVELLGQGWEGEVYKVAEQGTGIERAAKLYYPHRNPRGEALLRYARKLNKLEHVPIIIHYHHKDSARVRGERIEFMVSDFVRGEVLTQLIARQPGARFGSFEALHVLRALVSGVAPIHEAGEYHGDLHTDNVIIRRKGIGFEIKLLDFFDLGRPTRDKMADDVVDLAWTLYELIGGRPHYSSTGPEIRRIVCGLKRTLIRKRYPTASHLLRAMDSMSWPE